MLCRDNNRRFSAGMYHMLLNKANSPVLRNNFRHGNQVPSYLTCLFENRFFFLISFSTAFLRCIGVLMWYDICWPWQYKNTVNSYTQGERREANAVYENSKGGCWEALLAEIGGTGWKSEESLSKTKALVSLHLSSLNVIYADHGNPNTQSSYTQDWRGSYGVYENSRRSCRQAWPVDKLLWKMAELVEKRLCVKQKF